MYTEAEINALKSANYCFMLTHDNENLIIDLSYVDKLEVFMIRIMVHMLMRWLCLILQELEFYYRNKEKQYLLH